MTRPVFIALACVLPIVLISTAVGYRRVSEEQTQIDRLKPAEVRLQAELAHLTVEIDRLTQQEAERANLSSKNGHGRESPQLSNEAARLLNAIDDLRAWTARAQSTPRLPETQYMTPEDWVAAGHALGAGRTDADYLNAWLVVRSAAVYRTAQILWQALKDYMNDSGGVFPETIAQLAPYTPKLSVPSLFDHYQIKDSAAANNHSAKSTEHEKQIVANGRSLNLSDPSDMMEVRIGLGGVNMDTNHPTPELRF